MGEVSARSAARTSRRTGHNPHDSECVFWRGDFAGVDLRAVCVPCQERDLLPKPARQPNRFARALRVLLGQE